MTRNLGYKIVSSAFSVEESKDVSEIMSAKKEIKMFVKGN